MPKVQKKKIVGEGADGVTAKKEGTRKSQRLESQAKATIPPKKAAPKKAAELKGKKAAKGKKEEKAEDVPAENGEPKTEEICVSRSSVSVSATRNAPPSLLSIKGHTVTVRVKGN